MRRAPASGLLPHALEGTGDGGAALPSTARLPCAIRLKHPVNLPQENHAIQKNAGPGRKALGPHASLHYTLF